MKDIFKYKCLIRFLINSGGYWLIAGHHTSDFWQDKALHSDVKLNEPSSSGKLTVSQCLEQPRKHTLVQVKEGSSWQYPLELTAEFGSIYKHKMFEHYGQSFITFLVFSEPESRLI